MTLSPNFMAEKEKLNPGSAPLPSVENSNNSDWPEEYTKVGVYRQDEICNSLLELEGPSYTLNKS